MKKEETYWKVNYTWKSENDFIVVWAGSEKEAVENAVKILIENGKDTNCNIGVVKAWGVD